MKTRKVLFTMVTFLIAGTMVFAQEMKTEKFKVYGNCGMCESRIEKAAKGVDGVNSADWSQETKMLEVTYNKEKLSVDDVHMAVAKAGHDTEKMKADDETYKTLHGCCKYERKQMEKEHHEHGEGSHSHKHDHSDSAQADKAASSSCCGKK